VVAGALAWLSFELLVLLAPAQFRPAQRYRLAALGLGLVVYGWLWATNPTAFKTRPTTQPRPDAAPVFAALPCSDAVRRMSRRCQRTPQRG